MRATDNSVLCWLLTALTSRGQMSALTPAHLPWISSLIIIIIIIIIIIAFKGAIRVFLLSIHCAANSLQHVRSSGLGTIVCKSHATHPALITCNTSSADHMQHIQRWSHATCRVTRHMVRRDSSAIKFDSWNCVYLSIIILAEQMKEGRKPKYLEKTPDVELQKMPHTKAQRFKTQARLKPAQQHWRQARKADVLLHHASHQLESYQ